MRDVTSNANNHAVEKQLSRTEELRLPPPVYSILRDARYTFAYDALCLSFTVNKICKVRRGNKV